jgi:hypothetical protein
MVGVLRIQGNADWLRHDIARGIVYVWFGSYIGRNIPLKFGRKVSLVRGRKLFLVTRVGGREVVEVTAGLEWVWLGVRVGVIGRWQGIQHLLDALGLGLSILAGLGKVVLVGVHPLGQGIDPGHEVSDGKGGLRLINSGLRGGCRVLAIGLNLLDIVKRTDDNGVGLVSFHTAKGCVE